jgi:hypothetical protein
MNCHFLNDKTKWQINLSNLNKRWNPKTYLASQEEKRIRKIQ